MTHLTGPQSLVKTISLLGGPLLESNDFDWASDLPAGNAFFGWLADQLHDWSQNLEFQNVTSGNVDEVEDGKTLALEMRMYAALREMALEKEEVLVLSHDSSSQDAFTANDVSDSDYMPLSRIKKQASYINNEMELLKGETELLSSRLALSKKASQKLTRAIKYLQQALDEVRSNTRIAEEGLSEVSVKADTTIATTVINAKSLIHSLDISDPDDNTTMEITFGERSESAPNHIHDRFIFNQLARSSLVLTQISLTDIISDLRDHTDRISLFQKVEASKNENMQMEASRLKAALSSMNMKSGSTNYILTMDPELENICALLEHEADSREQGTLPTDLIQDFLQNLDAEDDKSEVFLYSSGVDVDAEISRAWCHDQLAILQKHGSGLDQASSSLAPLERLHASLSRVWHCVQEAEAFLEAFRDELEDIDMTSLNNSLVTKGDAYKVSNNDLSDPPSNTPSHEDILIEHLAWKKRLAVMESSEKAWIKALIHEYSLRPVHPSLPHIYANSPLTTCAPFAFPTEVKEIEAQARDRAVRLEDLVRNLEIQVHETFAKNNLTAKRLDTFVERWCGSLPQ